MGRLLLRRGHALWVHCCLLQWPWDRHQTLRRGAGGQDLGNVKTIIGRFTVAGGAIGSLELAGLARVGSIVIGDLDAVSFPNLKKVGGDVYAVGRTSLLAASFPNLKAVDGDFNFDRNAKLTRLTTPALATVGGSFRVTSGTNRGASNLASLELPMLETVAGTHLCQPPTHALCACSRTVCAWNRRPCPHSCLWPWRARPHRRVQAHHHLTPARLHTAWGCLWHLPDSIMLDSNPKLTSANFPQLKSVGANVHFYYNNANPGDNNHAHLRAYRKVGGTACADFRRACSGTCVVKLVHSTPSCQNC